MFTLITSNKVEIHGMQIINKHNSPMSTNKTILQFMSPERTWSLNDGHSVRRSRRWRERERADRHSSSDSPVLLVPPRITGLWRYLSGWPAPWEGEKKARQCKVKLQTVTKIPTNYGEDWKNSILRTCTALDTNLWSISGRRSQFTMFL